MVATTGKAKPSKDSEVLDTLPLKKNQTLCPVCNLPGFLASPRAVRNGKTSVDYYAVYFGHTFEGKRTWCYLHMDHGGVEEYLTRKGRKEENATATRDA